MNWLQRLSGTPVALASHPGQLRAKPLRVAGSYPLWPVVFAVSWVLSLLAAIDGFHWAALMLLAGATFVNYAYWSSIRPWFATGDVCAGVVVCEKPLLVATYTDLSTGDTPYPAVKICREPAKRFSAEAAKVGKPVACIARYGGMVSEPCWRNFYPKPVQCATDSGTEIKRILGEIDAGRWKELKAAINQIPRPFQPGLYRLSDEA